MNSKEITLSHYQAALRLGEQEWRRNAPKTYDDATVTIWEEEVLPRLLTGSLEKIDLEDLRLYCPLMLKMLQEAFQHDDVDDVRGVILMILENNDGNL